jgi:hypothetical protein
VNIYYVLYIYELDVWHIAATLDALTDTIVTLEGIGARIMDVIETGIVVTIPAMV